MHLVCFHKHHPTPRMGPGAPAVCLKARLSEILLYRGTVGTRVVGTSPSSPASEFLTRAAEINGSSKVASASFLDRSGSSSRVRGYQLKCAEPCLKLGRYGSVLKGFV